MTFICPACGATFPTDETCEDRFNVSQVREVEEPAYYAVHQLSVPAYMLQHNGGRATRIRPTVVGSVPTRRLILQTGSPGTAEPVRAVARRYLR